MNTPATSTTSTTARRGPRVVLWVLGVLLALVLAAWGLAAALFPPARVRALIQAQIAGVMAREVRYDDAHLSLWPPVRLTVTGPAIAEPGGFANGAAFRARSIHLDLDVLGLLVRRLVVRRLVLDQPQLHLLLGSNGTSNLDGLTRPPAPGGAPARPFDLAVSELRIQGGHALVDDQTSRRRVALALDTRLALGAANGGARITIAGETRVRELAFGPMTAQRPADLDRSLAGLDWRIEHRGTFDVPSQRLAVERLGVAFGGTELGVTGLVEHPGPAATLDLTARGHGVDLGQILGFLAAADAPAVKGIHAGGKLDFDLGIRGRVGPGRFPAVTGVLKVADASFRYPGAPAAVEKLRCTANFAPDSLGIGDLSAVVTGQGAAQPVTAQLVVTRFADPEVRFSVRGDVDLAAVGPLFALKDTRLGGQVALDLSGHGRVKDAANMTVDGHARLAQVTVEGAGLPRKVDAVNGEIDFSSTHADVKRLAARAGQSSFTLDA
ncbi:MAG: AsmA family protein, partial [Candidatus Eisenbacteria bacterium]